MNFLEIVGVIFLSLLGLGLIGFGLLWFWAKYNSPQG